MFQPCSQVRPLPNLTHDWSAPPWAHTNSSFERLPSGVIKSEEHTSELQSLTNLVCRLLLEKKKPSTERAAYCTTAPPISQTSSPSGTPQPPILHRVWRTTAKPSRGAPQPTRGAPHAGRPSPAVAHSRLSSVCECPALRRLERGEPASTLDARRRPRRAARSTGRSDYLRLSAA